MLFLDTLCCTLQNSSSEECLFLAGDFNCTEHALDRNHIEPHMPSRKRLTHIIKKHDLCDIWRQLNGDERQYTWVHTRDNVISFARLDRLYAFGHHLNIINSCSIVPMSFTDHAMVQCNVILNLIKPKSAYWHFNTSLLSDTFFKDSFKAFWENHRKTKSTFRSIQQWWDFGKIQIKQFCQQYTHNVTRELGRSLKSLEIDIKNCQQLADSTGDHYYLDTCLKKKAQLADLLGHKAQGALVRSRFQSIDQMDAPSKYFFSLEKKNGQRRLIQALRSEDGGLLLNPADIRRRAACFYQNLYRSELNLESKEENVFFDALPQMSEEGNAALSSPLSLGELHKALQCMESGRAPGVDGLPVDFFKTFWADLGVDLLQVLNGSLSEGRLPLSCRRAIITLIPKKGDLTDIKCWRPVSLLCSDYKLFSKTLANRLAGVMDLVIHPDQTYCVPGRSIFDNISLIRDILEVSNLCNLDFGLISLDQEKAFDRVEHTYLWRTLSAFGFCQKFIDMTKVLYSSVESVLKINGGLCAPFQVHRGIRQGCSLSGMLYSLAIEPLLHQLRLNIHGLSLPICKSNIRLSAYADDVMVVISGQNDMQVLLKLIEDFTSVSSAKINWTKCETLLVGQWTGGKPNLPNGLFWGKKGYKIFRSVFR